MGNVMLHMLPARMAFAVPVLVVEVQGTFEGQGMELAVQS